MAKPPVKPKSQLSAKPPAEGKGQVIPQQTVDLLNHRLGINVSTDNPDRIMAVMGSMTRSRSVSPYTSADMLQEYKDKGFPWLVDKVVETIDAENSHRQKMESILVDREQNRLDRAQYGALIIAVLGVAGCLIAGYLGVPKSICIAVALLAIGGPSGANIASRLVDHFDRKND